MAIVRRSASGLPRQWNPTQVPNFPVEVDWSHPLSAYMDSIFIPGLPGLGNGVIAQAPLISNGSPLFTSGPRGVATNPSAGFYSQIAPANAQVYQLDFLFDMPSAYTSGHIDEVLIQYNGNSAGTSGTYDKNLIIDYIGNVSFSVYKGTTFTTIAPSAIQLNKTHFISLSSNGSDALIYVDGPLVVTGTGNGGGYSAYGSPAYSLFGFGQGYYNFEGVIYSIIRRTQPLSAGLNAWLAAEPFAMLRPITRRPLIFQAGAVASLAASVSTTTTATAALTTGIQLAAAVAATTTATATLAGTGAALAAAVSATTTATGALSTSIQLAASVSATTSTAAALSTSINLAASAVVTTVATATITTSIQLAANSAASTTATAVLTAPGAGMSASVSTTTTAAGALTTSIQLATSVVATTTATANLTTGLGMANAFTLPNGKTQFFDANGKPLAGGKVYHYVPATTVPKDTYQDIAGATANTNPVVLDAAGEAVIFGVGAYRQILNDILGNLIWDQVTQTVTPATLGSVNLAGDTMTGTLVVPSLSDTGQQLVTATPTGDPITTLTSLNVQGTTTSATTREFLGVFSLTANKRNGAAGSVTPSVALYSDVNGTSGTSDVWAIRNVAIRTVGSGTYNMFGSEVDINNNNADYGNSAGAAGLAAPVTYGAVITGAGSFKNTAAMLISGPGTAIWNRGVCVTQNSVAQAAFQDLGNSTTSYDLQGTHTNGIDTLSATISGYAVRVADSHIIGVSVSGVNRPMLQHSTVGLYIGDVSDTFVVSKATVVPSNDNVYSLGLAGNRWAAVWAANGTIQTSDPSLKRNISPISSLKADVIQKLVASINPISFQWIDGGKVPSVDEAPGLVQATEDVIVSDQRVEIVNGSPVQKESTRTETRPIVDMQPVVDGHGKIVMIDAHDGTKRPLLHPVPRMVQGIVKTPTFKSTPGKRVHWGWDASEVKAAFDGVGLDFGGYVKDENGGQHLRPDQLVPVLWQAVKNLTARIETLEKGPAK